MVVRVLLVLVFLCSPCGSGNDDVAVQVVVGVLAKTEGVELLLLLQIEREDSIIRSSVVGGGHRGGCRDGSFIRDGRGRRRRRRGGFRIRWPSWLWTSVVATAPSTSIDRCCPAAAHSAYFFNFFFPPFFFPFSPSALLFLLMMIFLFLLFYTSYFCKACSVVNASPPSSSTPPQSMVASSSSVVVLIVFFTTFPPLLLPLLLAGCADSGA